ncbi:NAD(P)H-binding protein [Kibdelosporangium philippinense]|uniref:NAD(P)H-binding protein n=1 Tax=Kibdelosporangium philippinense TaxID=211113 RepID=A0ABS8Z4V0_9PSEU|nr:NAD(P)H-binding protein [Kibdelosporangium philippinense]MCE7002941.1 NAD(P)H-binding protein [Kibdelosporangium philippinense]
MTILITGGTGNIGRCVARLLADHNPRVMTRSPQRKNAVYGDFERPDTWADVLKGITSIYLFPFADAKFVSAAHDAGVRRFVVHSAAAAGFGVEDDGTALAEHLNEEREWHRSVEAMVESTGAEWTHIRPGLLAANALDWAEQIRATGVVREPNPDTGYPWVHELDVATLAVDALLTDDHVSAAYTITGPANVSQIDQVRAIGAAIGREIRFEECVPSDYPQWLVELKAGTNVLPPNDTFERLTGRKPRTFAQWARDHAADFR